MASALLFVALLVVLELSYRRWVRRTSSRRNHEVVDLTAVERVEVPQSAARATGDADVIPMPRRDESSRAAHSNG